MLHKYLLLFLILLHTSAYANMVDKVLPEAKLIGSGTLRYFLWDVYEAKLYSINKNVSFEQPFALSLHYMRSLEGNKIADVSAEQIRKLGYDNEVELATWHSQMRNIFPDVNENTTLTGIYIPGQATRFYQNDRQIGTINNPDFGRWFFGIWLNKNTEKPDLRKKLLGKSK